VGADRDRKVTVLNAMTGPLGAAIAAQSTVSSLTPGDYVALENGGAGKKILATAFREVGSVLPATGATSFRVFYPASTYYDNGAATAGGMSRAYATTYGNTSLSFKRYNITLDFAVDATLVPSAGTVFNLRMTSVTDPIMAEIAAKLPSGAAISAPAPFVSYPTSAGFSVPNAAYLQYDSGSNFFQIFFKTYDNNGFTQDGFRTMFGTASRWIIMEMNFNFLL
jgi:hypothetical protein